METSSTGTNEPNVRILASQHKSKKQNRHAIVECGGCSQPASWQTCLLPTRPVAAIIETSGEISEAMRDTASQQPGYLAHLDPEGNRFKNANTCLQILDLLRDMAEGGKKGAFVSKLPHPRLCLL